jgi:hypothetical protein
MYTSGARVGGIRKVFLSPSPPVSEIAQCTHSGNTASWTTAPVYVISLLHFPQSVPTYHHFWFFVGRRANKIICHQTSFTRFARGCFNTSIIIICWQVTELVEESLLDNYHVLFMSSVTQDLDRQFDEALESLTFDIEGQRVQSLTLQGLHNNFVHSTCPINWFILQGSSGCSRRPGSPFVRNG